MIILVAIRRRNNKDPARRSCCVHPCIRRRLCDKAGQLLATGRWFSLGAPVSSTNKIDRHDITEILWKVSLNTIKQTNQNKQDNDKRIHRLKSGLHGKINRIQQIISYFSILSNILNIWGSFENHRPVASN
jgi:hypothetical protein